MHSSLARLMALVCLAAIAPVALAAINPAYVKILENDQSESADHPWTGRYEGSHILLQSNAVFDEISFPTAKAVTGRPDKFSRSWAAEGRVTRSVYVTPEGRSSLEVLRNFQNHLDAGGFRVAWQCAADECGGNTFAKLKYRSNNKATHVSGLKMELNRARFVPMVFDAVSDIRYVLMQKGSGASAAYVGIFAATSSGGHNGELSDALNARTLVLVEVLDPQAMDAKIVTVKADAMNAQIRADGSVSLYGLLFDTAKADLKPASQAQLGEMIKYMNANPAAKVYIVGHTDNEGALDYNQGLSDRRAKAVVAALVAAGVSSARMAGRGVGPLAPVASNADESGRSKNRRVELVLQ